VNVTIVERDGDVAEIVIEGARAQISVITELRLEGDSLVLSGTHVHGPGAGYSSPAELREAARALARQFGASRVIIHGGRRTTGASPGHVPRPIVIELE
jgi:filamentous hemagglutinin